MAKELPYFKFEPSEWDNGNIQMCSRESKGLFVDICSIYWSRVGELPYALALQKLCNGNEDALQELKRLEIIAVIDGNIVIEFLEEQLSEFGNVSEKRRKAANKRWSDANALQVQSKSNAIREDKTREDKKKEEREKAKIKTFGNTSDTFFTIDSKYIHDYKYKVYKDGFKDFAEEVLMGQWFPKDYLAEVFWKEWKGKMFNDKGHLNTVMIKYNG